MSCPPSAGTFRHPGFGLRAVILAAILLPRALWAQAAASVPLNTNPPAARKPCVILIVANDLGSGDLGCYGQAKIKTPNIDQLAAEGMRFTSFYAGSSVSAASRAVLLTGRDSGHARIRGSALVPLQSRDLTMAELLRPSNYRTAVMGVWGLGQPGSPGLPQEKGFLEWFGYPGDYEAQNPYPEYLDRAQIQTNGVSKEISAPVLYDANVQNVNAGGKKGKYANDRFTEVALKYLTQSKPEYYNHYRPYFLYLPYTIPRAGNEPVSEEGSDYTVQRWPQPEKSKATMISRLDSYVGRIMEELKRETNELNTIVILTSAGGSQAEGGVDPKFFNGPAALRGAKGDLYEGGIRVPFIVRWPLQMKAGTVSDLPCAAWDVFPTVAEAAYLPPPKEGEGISLLPTLLGEQQTNRHESFYWEAHDHGFKQAARIGDWKAVRLAADGPLELYNLKSDPTEKTDVAEKNPEVAAKMEAYLKSARTDDPNWPMEKSPTTAQKKEGGG